MKNNKIVGITFGSFDLCHYGHVLMFEECKEYCDYLIVGVQSDPSIDRSEKNKPTLSMNLYLNLSSPKCGTASCIVLPTLFLIK